jgi:hypothetical protein
MEFSLPAWLGGLAGTVVAVVIYVPAIRVVERRMRAQSGPQTRERHAEFEDRLSVLRRLILAAGIAILATMGYWVGNAFGAAGAYPPLH